MSFRAHHCDVSQDYLPPITTKEYINGLKISNVDVVRSEIRYRTTSVHSQRFGALQWRPEDHIGSRCTCYSVNSTVHKLGRDKSEVGQTS